MLDNKTMKKLAILFSLIVIFYIAIKQDERKDLYILTWADYIPQEVLEDFTKETGINVRCDVCVSAEEMEVKLLTGRYNYDVVFPNVWPSFSKSIEIGLYKKIDLSLIPNATKVSKLIYEKMSNIKNATEYGIPFIFGFTSFCYNSDLLISEKLPTNSLAMLFDEENLKIISKYGKITIMDAPNEIIPLLLQYLGFNPTIFDLDNIKKAFEHLKKISKYISRFDSNLFRKDIISGETAIANVISDSYISSKIFENNLKYTIPKEGAFMWIEVVAIPSASKNTQNAHIFINFLLKEDINKKVIENIKSTSTILDREQILVMGSVIKSAYVDGNRTIEQDRILRRMWFEFKKSL